MLNNFLFSNYKIEDKQHLRRYILLKSFLALGVLILLFLAPINYFILNEPILATLNILVAIFGIFTCLDLRYNQNLNRSIVSTLIVLIAFFIAFVYLNENRGFGLIWIHVLPILSIGLLGAKRGTIVSILYFIPIFTITYFGIGEWLNGEWCIIGFFRLIFSSLLVIYIVVMMDIALEKSYLQLEELSSTDSLTNIYNRRKINEIIKRETELSKRYHKHLALILFDVDDFKKINDTLGHNGGDKVLKKLTKEIKNSLRESDYIGRWGGEEFIIVIPEIDKDHAEDIAEKIRKLVEDMECDIQDTITCSFGIAIFDKDNDSSESLINKADIAMYRAKENGKNCVVVYT